MSLPSPLPLGPGPAKGSTRRPESQDSLPPYRPQAAHGGECAPSTGACLLAKTALSSVEKKERVQRTGTRDPLPDSRGPAPAKTVQRRLRLHLFYFNLVFNVGLRQAGEEGEEEHGLSLEPSLCIPLLITHRHLPTPTGPHRDDSTVPLGVTPDHTRGTYGRMSRAHTGP